MTTKRVALVIVVGFAFGAADQYLGSRVMLGDQFALGLWASTVGAMSTPCFLPPPLIVWDVEMAVGALAALCFAGAAFARRRPAR